MALYAFDGTGNKDHDHDGDDSNVLKFYEAYVAGYRGRGRNLYQEGVGVESTKIEEILGSAFGYGGRDRIEKALKRVKENLDRGDVKIDVVGFSRGAALALEFVNEIHEKRFGKGKLKLKVRFLGIWDTVASFGVPGNRTNLGYTLTVPPNVRHACHAIALDERRFTFPLTRIVRNAYSRVTQENVKEVWFRGFHSDVGGGNDNEALSSIPLVWMFKQAKQSRISIPKAYMDKHAALRDPKAICCKPDMDKRANTKRNILVTDIVHESVSRRASADGFPANNPPRGLQVMDDDGELLEDGFM